jgi:hypothetical protein
MTLQIGEVIYRGVLCYFCAASDGERRWLYITSIGCHLESMVVRMNGRHEGKTYCHIVFYIHKTGSRIFVYDIDILDEISGII